MQFDILHVPGCPHVAPARARLRKALERLGLTATLREVRIDSAEAAATAGMRGSPTILIDGRDPFPAADGSSLSCRLYATAGGIDGAPTVDQLVDALSLRRRLGAAVAGCCGAHLFAALALAGIAGALPVVVAVAVVAAILTTGKRDAHHG